MHTGRIGNRGSGRFSLYVMIHGGYNSGEGLEGVELGAGFRGVRNSTRIAPGA